MSLPIMLILIGVTEGLLHYALRKEVLGKDLPRPAAYTLGTLAMMLPFTYWLWEHGYIEVVWVLWGVLATGGASVMLWYALDWARGAVVSVREMKAREEAALETMHEALDDAKK